MRPLQDKLKRVNEARPAPPSPSKKERHTRHFCICLVSSTRNSIRTLLLAVCVFLLLRYKHEGLLGIKSFVKWTQKHSKTQTHVQRYLQIELFGKQQRDELLLDAQRRNDVTRNNEWVKKNRVICRFIHAVCSLAYQDFPFRNHDECCKQWKFRGISVCVDKSQPTAWQSSEFSHCYLISNTNYSLKHEFAILKFK